MGRRLSARLQRFELAGEAAGAVTAVDPDSSERERLRGPAQAGLRRKGSSASAAVWAAGSKTRAVMIGRDSGAG